MFWNPGHQKSSEVANQRLEVILCTILDPILWFDVLPLQAHPSLHRKDVDSPVPSPSHSQICALTASYREPWRLRSFSLPTTESHWNELWSPWGLWCLGSWVPPQGQNQMNKDFMKELFDLDIGKYFKTKSYEGSWFFLVSSKGFGSYSFPQKVLGRSQARI